MFCFTLKICIHTVSSHHRNVKHLVIGFALSAMKLTGDCIMIQLTNDGVIERQKLQFSVILYIFFKIIGISNWVCLNPS